MASSNFRSRDTVQVNVMFPRKALKELDAVAGPRRRSEFVVEATLREIGRRRFLQSVRSTSGILKKEDYPEFATGEKVDKFIRNLRESDLRRTDKHSHG